MNKCAHIGCKKSVIGFANVGGGMETYLFGCIDHLEDFSYQKDSFKKMIGGRT